MTYKLLDLYSCAGGAAVGYHKAGFEVIGVDINPQPRYPFEHHVADALEFVAAHGHEYDAIHASPPCQAFSATKSLHTNTHPDLIGPTREALQATGKPYVIENVPRSPLVNPITLCGTEFGLTALDVDGVPLKLIRHRLFESNVPLARPSGCNHDKSILTASVYGAGGGVDPGASGLSETLWRVRSAYRRMPRVIGGGLDDQTRAFPGSSTRIHRIGRSAAYSTFRGRRQMKGEH